MLGLLWLQGCFRIEISHEVLLTLDESFVEILLRVNAKRRVRPVLETTIGPIKTKQ